jgi:hypothetical protein
MKPPERLLRRRDGMSKQWVQINDERRAELDFIERHCLDTHLNSNMRGKCGKQLSIIVPSVEGMQLIRKCKERHRCLAIILCLKALDTGTAIIIMLRGGIVSLENDFRSEKLRTPPHCLPAVPCSLHGDHCRLAVVELEPDLIN